MNQVDAYGADGMTEKLLAELATMPVAEGAAALTRRGLASAATVLALAQYALARAEQDPDAVDHWLAIAQILNDAHADNDANAAWIAYAEGRLQVVRGGLVEAEASLRTAQGFWHMAGDSVALARSQLGLTQILAMQGRFDEADTAINEAIESLITVAKNDANLTLQLAVAHRNRAALLSVQDRHHMALDAFDAALAKLDALPADRLDDGPPPDVMMAERAHIRLNQAVSFTFLDRVDEAEIALQAAITSFDELGDPLNRGRARTNLGTLYVRTGRYADALAIFNDARRDLFGDTFGDELLNDADEENVESLHQAAILLLDQSTAHLALNLRPETRAGLTQCEALFRRAGQPYELGQTLYMRGLLAVADRELAQAGANLAEALTQFEALDNRYWRDRVRLAQALLAYRREEGDMAATLVAALLESRSPALTPSSQIEARLLQLHLALDEGDLAAARASHAAAEARLADLGDATAMPHLRWRLIYALGLIASTDGDLQAARRHFFAAVEMIEAQRISLPLEEVRSAYLDDKTDLYAALVATLLDMQGTDETALADAFAVVERARARALLERLLAAAPDEQVDANTQADPAAEVRRRELRSRLHWLYNQLLGEGGDQRAVVATNQAIIDHEAALQPMEWRRSPLLAQAEPVTLRQLQQTLAADEQAVVYFSTAREVMAFVVDAGSVAVMRDLCTPDDVTAALRNWRFQLGRAEIGGDYFVRHCTRLISGAQAALARLYDLLIAPLAPQLTATRLRFIPHDQLHHVPFHALFDGERYLLERWESIVAPSASIAVICHQHRTARVQGGRCGYDSLAALAISEPGLPNVHAEVRTAASHFAQSQLYLDASATAATLQHAAGQTDVLHIATHGLMRADNPYFSALKLADGWQDVRTLYHLPLAASLVVLSACESGAGQVQGGDEVVGLARGFIGAGASMLVASLWNVHDESAARLMADFYAALTRSNGSNHVVGHAVTPPTALRAAQLYAIDDGRHPYFWAPFYVIG